MCSENTGVQNVYRHVFVLGHWWAVRGRPAWLRREVSAQMCIRQGRNLNLHFRLLRPTFLLAQNPSQKRSTGKHKRFWKVCPFCTSWQKMGTTSMQGTANTIAQPVSSPLADQSTPVNCEKQQSFLPFSHSSNPRNYNTLFLKWYDFKSRLGRVSNLKLAFSKTRSTRERTRSLCPAFQKKPMCNCSRFCWASGMED